MAANTSNSDIHVEIRQGIQQGVGTALYYHVNMSVDDTVYNRFFFAGIPLAAAILAELEDNTHDH